MNLSPKPASTAPPPPRARGRRSPPTDAPAPAITLPKRGRRSLVQPLPNGDVKTHKRKASIDKQFSALAYGHDFQAFNTRSPRIKLKFKTPEPLITHPLHIPRPKDFNSLSAYLDSFISLDDNEDITLEKAQSRAAHEATILDRIALARKKGWLTDDPQHPSAPKRQQEPAKGGSRHEVLLKHVLNFSGLMQAERRGNVSRAKKIAGMVQAHFKRLEGTDEKELKAEEKRIRRLAKVTGQEVRKKWKLAEKVRKPFSPLFPHSLLGLVYGRVTLCFVTDADDRLLSRNAQRY